MGLAMRLRQARVHGEKRVRSVPLPTLKWRNSLRIPTRHFTKYSGGSRSCRVAEKSPELQLGIWTTRWARSAATHNYCRYTSGYAGAARHCQVNTGPGSGCWRARSAHTNSSWDDSLCHGSRGPAASSGYNYNCISELSEELGRGSRRNQLFRRQRGYEGPRSKSGRPRLFSSAS